MNDQLTTPNTFNAVRELIAAITNQNEEEIKPDSNFTEDLGIEIEDEENVIFSKLVHTANDYFDINLDPELFLDADPDSQTVGYFTELIKDEVEL